LPFKKRLQLRLFSLFRQSQRSLHDLRYLFWECTLKCNLTCLHCGSDCTATSSANDMPLRDFIRVLDSIKDKVDPQKTMVVLTGGEPSLRSDLAECGKAITALNYPWGMVTNGFALTENKFNELVDCGLRSITVSLDGLEASHDWLRGREGSFTKALKAIQFISKNSGIVSDVVTCYNQKNKNELYELRKMLVDSGVKRWRLFTIFPKGRAATNTDLDVQPQDFLDLMNFIQETNTLGSIKADFGCEGYLGPYEGIARSNFFFCRAGISIGSVLADGSISACPSLRGDYIQGNIYADDFYSVWDNRFDVMRNRSWMKSGACRKCDQYVYCSGNGLHLRDEKTGALLRCHYSLIKDALEKNTEK
jgi:radical SAM enzyme (rSAM/lipoprotein system)